MKIFHFEHKIMEQGQQIEYLKRVRDEHHQTEKQFQTQETEWNQKMQVGREKSLQHVCNIFIAVVSTWRRTFQNTTL